MLKRYAISNKDELIFMGVGLCAACVGRQCHKTEDLVREEAKACIEMAIQKMLKQGES